MRALVLVMVSGCFRRVAALENKGNRVPEADCGVINEGVGNTMMA